MHPLAGTWIANIAKSRRHANHQFESATMVFEVTGADVVLTYDGINASGNREGNTQRFNADGRERPIAEAPGYAAITTLGPRALEALGKKDGAVVGRGTYEVSEDGRTMTATIGGTDASGAAFEQVIVFDRATP